MVGIVTPVISLQPSKAPFGIEFKLVDMTISPDRQLLSTEQLVHATTPSKAVA